MTDYNPFESAKARFSRAADILGLEEEIFNMIVSPAKEIKVNLPITMDNGKIKIFEGFRVLHSTYLGPGKGGVRYAPNVNIDEVKALAAWMSLKSSIMNIPFGGGKGGIKCNPRDMSNGELERLTRAYITALGTEDIGPDKDIPAPDMNTGPQTMAWMMDQYSRLSGRTVNAVVTGKPLVLGGSLGRVEATGRGVMVSARLAMAKLGMEYDKVKIAIQGFGNVGGVSADLLNRIGGKVVAISDISGAYYNPNGIDIPAAINYYNSHKNSLEGFRGADLLPNAEELLTLDVDVLVPAAVEDVINKSNASDIKAKLIVEGANGPVAADADEILLNQGITIVPDILANAGGVTVSYFEWVQNRLGYNWTEERVKRRADRVMNKAFDEVWETAGKHDVTLRIAAYMVGINRIAQTIKLRGVF
ncbi:MAG: Glu/Leu/Phe/Val family dehydrogenase [Bacteroidia bacterium]